jgi:hypothetical protein
LAASSTIAAAFTALPGDASKANTPWFASRTAGARVRPARIASPMWSPSLSAYGAHGISPPNSSAIAVSAHGIERPTAAHAVAKFECVWTTPPIEGSPRYRARW